VTSPTIVSGVVRFLSGHPPFSLFSPEDLAFVAQSVSLVYHADGELLLGPDSGPPQALFIVKQGIVRGEPPPGRLEDEARMPSVRLHPGEVFPAGALMADRPVASEYRASGDVFCWTLPKAAFDELLQRSDVFLDFCKRRTSALFDLSQQMLHGAYARQASQWRSMATPLGDLVRRPPVTVEPTTPLRQVFERMEAEHVGSVIVQAGSDTASLGIFTRRDVIGRVVLPAVALDAPVADVMTAPIITMPAQATIGDAILAMAAHSIRHIPVMHDGHLAGVVTERDLFAFQRQTLRGIGGSIQRARDVASLAQVAADIRGWARSLVAQGVSPAFATRLISRLNDQVTERLVVRAAAEANLSLESVCWIAMGSEGREEQTIATDQDNGLVLADALAGRRDDYLAFAQAVNHDLDRCGYPLCKGGIMAGNPKWCLTQAEWRQLFDTWIDRGDPQSLLAANIFFDFRPLAGDAALADALREHVTARAAATPRFLKQMSDNALTNGPPASWTGGLIGQFFAHGTEQLDLKLNGTVPFVDGARLLALAHRIPATNTAERLQALATQGVAPESEVRGWVDAFQFLQGLRLRVQMESHAPEANPNQLDAATLSELDRRILKEAFRQARKLQQRFALDYAG
jgi:CBS domain-containing protein